MKPAISDATFLHSEPQLFVTNMERSLSFYVDKLGFAVAFTWGQPAHYAQVIRGGARLNLRHTDRKPFDAAFRQSEGDVLSATVAVDQAKPVFEEMSAKNAQFHQILTDEPWEARTFIVRDPDDNLICFAGS